MLALEHGTVQDESYEHEPHLVAERWPGRERGRCRRETSFARGEGQDAFSDRLGGKEQGFADVLSFEIRVKARICSGVRES